MSKISTSDTGHAKNVANFNKMIAACTGYGTAYNPSNPNLAIKAMTPQAAGGDASVKAVAPAQKPYKDAEDARHQPFIDLPQLVRDAYNELASCDGVSATTLQTALNLEKKIAGTNRAPKPKGVTPPVNPPEPTKKSHSTSQQSFDMRLAAFNDFISLLAGEPNYITNQPDLMVTALTSTAATLGALNQAIEPVYTPYQTALTVRDTALYFPVTGIYDTQAKVKKYVSGNRALSATAKKEVLSLKFTKPPQKDLHF